VGETCDPIDDELFIETNGYVIATARFAGYTQSFGYYTDACVGNAQTELFNVTTTGYLTECSAGSSNPGASCIEDSDCPGGTCVAPYDTFFLTGGGSSIVGFYDDPSGSPQWFSQPLLNAPNSNDHMVTYRAADFNPLFPEYLIAWEDLDLGDADYNDLVVVLQYLDPCVSLECCDSDGDCDDSDNCTVDTCVDSVCQNTPVDCSSVDDQCNVGVCDPGTGNCVQDPTPKNGDPCDDGALCTVNDTCDNGTCGGTGKDCSSVDDQCNVGVCDPGTGNCVQDPTPENGDPCDDGVLCTVNDTCDNGVCSGLTKDCSSVDNQCNMGICDSGTGNCIQDPTPYNGDPCDDGNPGTANDTCSNGVCTGNPVGAAIPTLSEWGMIIFMTIILGIGVVFLLRKRML
jgi:hypothetical protein